MRLSQTYIELFGISIHWYGLLIVLGMCLAMWLCARRESGFGLPKDTTVDLALISLPCAILGARLYYILFSLSDYAGREWWRVFAVWEGGLAVYGGILGGVAAGALYAKRTKKSFLVLCDLVAPAIALGQAVGRWGNFVNMEAYGDAVTLTWLRFFPMSVRIGGIWHYATFFYESVWCLFICISILTAEKRGRLRFRGNATAAYILLYALERTAVEGLRTDSLYLGPMRVSQVLSLVAAFTILVFLIRKDHSFRGYVPAAAMLGVAVIGVCLGSNPVVFVSCGAACVCALPGVFRRTA